MIKQKAERTFDERNLQSPGVEEQEKARGKEVSAGGGDEEEVKGQRAILPAQAGRGSHDPVSGGSGVERRVASRTARSQLRF